MLSLRCALHVHSTWSDGEFTLDELRAALLNDGVRVACMADHDIAFTEETLDRYRAECARVSDADFLCIAGVEFTASDRMHIVGFGVTTLIDSFDPATIFRHIERHDGVSVLAHPRDSHFEWIEGLAHLPHGLEVWNSKYDGRHGPRLRTFELYERLKSRSPLLRAYYGQDLHWKTQSRALVTDVNAAACTPADILAALRAGAFTASALGTRFPSDGVIDRSLLLELDRAQRRASARYALLKNVKRALGPVARWVPPAVKAQFRRFF